VRRTLTLSFVVLALVAAKPLAQATAKTLDIYYIDTEGGQATLFVSPAGQTVLVDTGNTGTRDPDRIMDAAKAAGVKQIDYLVMTHYHGDHVGGFPELAQRIPILHFVDHGPTVQPEQNSPAKQAYDAAIKNGPYMMAKPGDRLPLTGIDWTIVSAAGKVLKTNMAAAPGAGRANPYCADFKTKDIQVDLENGQSTGSVITYGKFRTVDLGDLLWNVEGELMCPINHIGTVDLYMTSHHGMAWSGSAALVYALQPRVVVMNNGTRKGAQIETYETLESAPGLEDLWQLHWSFNGVLEHNPPGRFIANMEDAATSAAIAADPPPPVTSALGPPPPRGSAPPAPIAAAPGAGRGGPQLGNPAHTPAYWIKVSARPDGTFTVTNPRNGFSKTYKAH
jgi:competence protein ComEC